MSHYAGLDVSLETTSVCIVGEDGRVVLEGRIPTELDEVIRYLAASGFGLGRIGLEARPLSRA